MRDSWLALESMLPLTNVNSCYKMNQQLLNSTNIDNPLRLEKFAQYGIVTFLVPCFDSPVFVGKLESADPSNPYVIAQNKL